MIYCFGGSLKTHTKCVCLESVRVGHIDTLDTHDRVGDMSPESVCLSVCLSVCYNATCRAIPCSEQSVLSACRSIDACRSVCLSVQATGVLLASWCVPLICTHAYYCKVQGANHTRILASVCKAQSTITLEEYPYDSFVKERKTRQLSV